MGEYKEWKLYYEYSFHSLYSPITRKSRVDTWIRKC